MPICSRTPSLLDEVNLGLSCITTSEMSPVYNTGSTLTMPGYNGDSDDIDMIAMDKINLAYRESQHPLFISLPPYIAPAIRRQITATHCKRIQDELRYYGDTMFDSIRSKGPVPTSSSGRLHYDDDTLFGKLTCTTGTLTTDPYMLYVTIPFQSHTSREK